MSAAWILTVEGQQPRLCCRFELLLFSAGLVFVQSDVRTVVEYMHETFQQSEPRLQRTADVADLSLQDAAQLLRPRECCENRDGDEDCGGWASLAHNVNPLGLPTEREVHSTDKGKEVYRFMLQKRH